MENKKNNNFDKMHYLRTTVNHFINKDSAEKVDKVYSQFIELLPSNAGQNEAKRQILEICRDLFVLDSFREAIYNAKKRGTHPSELINIIVSELSPKVLGRHYNMANLRSEGMVSMVTTSSEIAKKRDINQNKPKAKPIEIQDLEGNTISIQYLDTIIYKTGEIGEYINQYEITRYIGEKKLPPVKVYTEIDFSRLSADEKHSEYYRAVANHLLSVENIQYSNANGYIGGLTAADTGLKVGEERFEKENNNNFSSYTYQISSQQALYFNRIEKEAVMSYLEKEQKRDENDGR